MGNKKSRNLKVYFLISSLVVFLSSFLIFYIFENQVKDIKLEELKEDEENLILFQDQLLGKEFRMVIGDLHYLRNVYEDRLYDGENKEEIFKEWIEFSNQRQIYDQMRFIDKNGDERIRINYDGNKASLVDKSKLQNKKDRYYFYETALLEKEKIYISPLDLNIEGEEIEIPFKAMIRFSTPLYDDRGDFQGIIILNYLANTALENFKSLAENSQGEVALLNSDGYWLSSEDKNKEWSFMFEDMKNLSFSKDYPEEWQLIKAKNDQVISENGLFTFTTVHLNKHYKDENNSSSNDGVVYSDDKWHIISLIDTDNDLAPYFLNNPILIIKDVFKKNSYQLILIAFISGLVGYFVYLNRRKYYKIKYYSEYDPLTKALNRRAGYKKIDDLTSKTERKKVLFSLCFIDVNGLKEVNDSLGHEYGDELIITVSDIIRSTIRKDDFLIRQGGDEFLIILDGIDTDQAEKVWMRIVSKFEEINRNDNRLYIISLSHGIVEYKTKNKSTIDELIQKADEKMYEEKNIIKKNFNVLR